MSGFEASKAAGKVRQPSEQVGRESGEEGECIMELENLLKGIDFDSTTGSEPADQTEDLKGPDDRA